MPPHAKKATSGNDDLTGVALSVLKRMVKDGATIRARRTFPFPHKYIIKNPVRETQNPETTASVVADLVTSRCIVVVKHDANYDDIEYAVSDRGRIVAKNDGRLW